MPAAEVEKKAPIASQKTANGGHFHGFRAGCDLVSRTQDSARIKA
jgi:hypothetical protein